MGSGPEPPFLKAELADLGAEAWWPLADFATSRGRGAGGAVIVVVVADIAEHIRLLVLDIRIFHTFITIDFYIRS